MKVIYHPRSGHEPRFSIPVTLIAPRADDTDGIQSLLRKTAWSLVDFACLEEAVTTCRRSLTPIVLCDLELNGQPWPRILRRLNAVRPGACVIFLTDACPDALRDELLEGGAFDVLTRPIDRHNLLLALLFAYSHCKANWPRRSPRTVEPIRIGFQLGSARP